MSIHKSLKLKGAMQRTRNVYTRAERLEKLKEQGRWSEGDSVYGLPKVRALVVKVGGKKKKKKKEEETAESAS
ncbi:MAG: small basic protein [Planctomycetota bacterium]|nr:MAG: small basic protein [Planctomycetota bacterium]